MKKDEATPKRSNTESAPTTIISDSAPGKLKSMLHRFAMGNSYHRFSAERIGDHVLPTTISDLQKMYGIRFDRKRIKVKNRFGKYTSVCLYWLSGKSLIAARRIAEIDKEAA